MKYILDKRSGNKLSVLGFGCMRFPTKGMGIDYEKAEELICGAVDSGVNYFDTAYIYGGSEDVTGRVIEKNGLRDKIYLATKLPLVLVKKAEDFDRFFSKQLERLRTDHIDYYLMHMIQSFDGWNHLKAMGIERWIEKKKAEGSIKQIGFSYHGSKNDFFKVLDDYPWDFCQIQYNYSDPNYQAGVEGLRKADSMGILPIIMEPLLGGKLVDGLPDKAKGVFKETRPDLTTAQWGLRWLWNQPEVGVVLSGMSSMVMLEENVFAASTAEPGMLTVAEEDSVSEVMQIFSQSFKVPCTSCGYCMPCPTGVNIPSCFSSYNSHFSHGKKVADQQYFLGSSFSSEKPSIASNCIKCGKCEKLCPQHIPIMAELENVAADLETPWFKIKFSVSRLFSKKKTER